MDKGKKSNPLSRYLDRLRSTNKEKYAPGADNSARLDYVKGNIKQDREKIVDVWDACPVLDEEGKPVEENNKDHQKS